ncbi:lipopolysaccharide biosynthesis protein [Mycobacterium rufum]|nr:lipopolysaccharide biosynthesis protein [Mycolicibacterium rufum]
MTKPREDETRTSAKKAGVITLTGQLAKALVQLAGLIAFSHLLTPRDVGLIGMVAVFLLLGELIRDFGLSQAAIQTAELSHGQASNLFWTNALVGLVMSASLFVAAPAVADLYNEPALSSIAPWIAVTFTINALQMQFQVRLARDFRFLTLTLTDVFSQLAGLVLGLIAALLGAAYWALVVQLLVASATLLVLRAGTARWVPGAPRREAGMSALYMFGLHSGLAQLVQYVASNADSFTIGIRWGAAPLGIYNRAFQIFSAPANQLLAPLTNVALPILSRQRHEGRDFYPLLLKAQIAISAALTFVFAVVGSLSEPLVRLALGSAWRESAPLLSILSIGGAAQALSFMAYWAFLASGNARQLFLHSLVTKPILAVAIVLGSVWGLTGVAWGFSLGLVVSWFISLGWLAKCDGMPARVFLSAGLYVLQSGLVTGAVLWLLNSKFGDHAPSVVILSIGFLAGGAIYATLLCLRKSNRTVFRSVLSPVAARVKPLLQRN